MNPASNYYDGWMATQFETCIKDKFEGLTQINELPANYIRAEIEELEEERNRMASESESSGIRDGIKI